MTNEQQRLNSDQEVPEDSGFTQTEIDKIRQYPAVSYLLERGPVEIVSINGVTLLPDRSDSVRPLDPMSET